MGFMTELTPELLLNAYKNGLFPMAPAADSPEIHWYDPPLRGILPLPDFHISKKLKRTLHKTPWAVTVNRDFPAVIRGCARPAPGRAQTWINAQIEQSYIRLHETGHAHSLEVWDGPELAGGIYGLAIGGAFFGESMFSEKTDASKIALVHLAARLWGRGFRLFDTQFINDHLRQFGAQEIPRAVYKKKLETALQIPARFYSGSAGTGASCSGTGEDFMEAFLQSMTQTS